MPNKSKPNRLINEKSPYLLQHAHNPVDWFPWGEEAFEKAKRENKPVLVSIGYSTCHWLQVISKGLCISIGKTKKIPKSSGIYG
ncbi:DUF255 domain-containing protein [Bacillus subtilis]|uniref:DUF255 domain-containing protein n=1 Tax=Bacillus subtilis TaxID=1423 RepID=UPI002545DD6A|nr:DUF255 domain-containing protein [Bacillus subtilis]MEC2196794.1 DUF255 domain-containing protein [Bacillus subtilis]